MIKILLVEDEAEKKRLLMASALEVDNLTIENIDIASDVYEAKKAISNKKYDLIILDINIPLRSDKRPEVGAGIQVLQFIKNNKSAIAPSYIVGMTAYDDNAELAAKEFSSPLWKLVKFSYKDLSWKEPLKEAIKYLISQNTPPYTNDGKTFHFDLGIFVALEGVELESIKNLSSSWSQIHVSYDHSRYYQAVFEAEDHSKFNVVVVAAPKMGMPPAAVITSKLIQSFRPRYLAITGICAGVRDKTKIGDILIADPCFDWGSGKWVRDKKTKQLKFRPAPYQWRLDEALRSALKELGDKENIIQSIHDSFEGNKPEHLPTVRIEAMASGGSVLQATELMDDVQDLHKNLVGVEMESYAVFTAAEYFSDPRPTCFSIKSVCDFGDEQKCDDFHKYAAHTSAKFLYEFVTKKLFNNRFNADAI